MTTETINLIWPNKKCDFLLQCIRKVIVMDSAFDTMHLTLNVIFDSYLMRTGDDLTFRVKFNF